MILTPEEAAEEARLHGHYWIQHWSHGAFCWTELEYLNGEELESAFVGDFLGNFA